MRRRPRGQGCPFSRRRLGAEGARTSAVTDADCGVLGRQGDRCWPSCSGPEGSELSGRERTGSWETGVRPNQLHSELLPGLWRLLTVAPVRAAPCCS